MHVAPMPAGVQTTALLQMCIELDVYSWILLGVKRSWLILNTCKRVHVASWSNFFLAGQFVSRMRHLIPHTPWRLGWLPCTPTAMGGPCSWVLMPCSGTPSVLLSTLGLEPRTLCFAVQRLNSLSCCCPSGSGAKAPLAPMTGSAP